MLPLLKNVVYFCTCKTACSGNETYFTTQGNSTIAFIPAQNFDPATITATII
jgi:hypothetical protein